MTTQEIELKKEIIRNKRRNNLKKARKVRAEMASKGILKNKTTILKENWEAEARDRYLAQVEPYLPAITKQQITQAKTGDAKTQQYIINQAIGKPKERIEQDLSSETLKKIEQQDRVWAKKEA